MRQEQLNALSTGEQSVEENASQAMLALRRKNAVEQANGYLARFAPLLYALQTEDPTECRNALQTVRELRAGGAETLAALEQYAEAQDVELVTTLRAAIGQSETIEVGLRRRLATLQPGTPEGHVDLAALRANLAQVAAHQELAEVTGTTGGVLSDTGDRLEIETADVNGGKLGVTALAAFGILSIFTMESYGIIFGLGKHAPLMALFFMLFFCAFLGIGTTFLWAAIDEASQETVVLEGREIIIRKKLGPWVRETRRTLGPNSKAGLVAGEVRRRGQGQTEIALLDADNKEFRIGRGASELLKQQYVERINQYIRRAIRLA